VKVVFDKKEASTNPWKVAKKVEICGMSRRDPALSGRCSSSLKDDARTEDGESWGGLGLGRWNYAGTAEAAMHGTGRRFYNFTEEAQEGVISNRKV
jgi:hypothetical protein